MDRKNKTKVQYDTHIYESEDPREDSGAYVQEIDADDDHDDDFDPFSKSKAKSAQVKSPETEFATSRCTETTFPKAE